MARDVNWWLMSLAFLLGLLLTLALTIRKVTREVPVGRTAEVPKPHLDKKVAGAVAATGAAAAATLHSAADKVETKVEDKAAKVEAKAADVEHKVAHVEHKVAEVAHKVERRLEPDVLEEDPYGSGSIRVSARTVGPAGYTIKGDKDTGRYFTPDSPEYAEIEAEVWFANEESAEKAGFLRWNATGDVHPAGLVSAGAATVVTEGHHVVAETVITEDHSAGDSTLVIVDDGIPETKIVIVDDGIPEAESRIRIVGVD